MAIHDQLPIHRTGVKLLTLAVRAQEQMPRGMKHILGAKIADHCVKMLDRMAMANATQKAVRAAHIAELLSEQRATTILLRVAFDARYMSPKLWGEAVELLASIGAQAGGWLRSANRAPAA